MRNVIKVFVILLMSMTFLSLVEISKSVSQNDLIQIATEEFEKTVPIEYRSEYSKFTVQPDPMGRVTWITWQREINSIPVRGDKFFIRLYSSNGEVINYEYDYSGPANEFDTISTVTKQQAAQIALNSYGGSIIKVERDNPYLEIHGKDLLWMINLVFTSEEGAEEGRLWLGLDADTGETKVFNPSEGLSIQQLPTSFTPPWYQPLLLYPEYVAITIVAIVGALIYLRKTEKTSLFKK